MDNVDLPTISDKFRNMGFQVFCKNRHNLTNWRSGGVLIAIRTNFAPNYVQRTVNTDFCVCVQINSSILNFEKNLVIMAAYIPPHTSRYSNIGMFDDLTQSIIDLSIDTNYLVLCGDLNAHTNERQDWQADQPVGLAIEAELDALISPNHSVADMLKAAQIPLYRKSTDTSRDLGHYGTALIELCKNLDICIVNGRWGDDKLVGKPTSTDNTVIDYMICSPVLITKAAHFYVHDFDNLFSDKHCIVELVLEGSTVGCHKREPATHNSTQESVQLEVFGKWDSERKAEYADNIVQGNVENLLQNWDDMTIDEISDKISETLLDSARKTFPTKLSKNNHGRSTKKAAWFSQECRNKRKLYLKAKKRNNICKSEVSREDLKIKSKAYKKEIAIARRDFSRRFNDDLRKMKTKNPKQYWKLINDCNKCKTPPVQLPELNEHFKNLSDSDPLQEQSMPQGGKLPVLDTGILNSDFTAEEVVEGVASIKGGKAAGIDRVTNDFIKSTISIFLPVYVQLFNRILSSGTIPKSWIEGLVVPIYKGKGDPNDVNNYRGITLLSCLGKLFTNLLNARLHRFCDVNSILNENQAGFRHGYSTIDHIYVLKHFIDIFIMKKKRLFCTFIDYSKAFDLVWRDALWFKLQNAGITGRFYNVIVCMYKQIKSCVFVDGIKSESFTSLTGVRQGENLSPLLFSLFINDLEEFLIENKCEPASSGDDMIDRYMKLLVLMYADDTIVMATSKSGLQEAIDQMCNFCKKWKLKINSSKTKVTVFGHYKTNIKKYKFLCDGQELEAVHSFKYLGIVFNFNGAFKLAIDDLYKRASKAMFSLLAKCRKHNFPIDIRLELFDRLVTPVMLYACEVWGPTKMDVLEKLHLKFLKYTLKVKMSTCSNMVYGELGRYPLRIEVNKRVIGYWGSLLKGKETKFSRTMYDCLFNLSVAGVYTAPWISHVRQVLDECGLSYMWLEQSCENVNWTKAIVEQRLKDQFLQNWHSELNGMSSCDFYCQIKDSIMLEKYLLCPSAQSRQALCNLRLSNNRIPKIVGRYKGIERSKRFCHLCVGDYIGDEFHVIFECTNKDIVFNRNKYLPKYFARHPSMYKCVSLLQTSNQAILSKLGTFLSKVLPLYR